MPTLNVEGAGQYQVPEGKRLVLALEQDAGIDQLHACGGNARCTTCRVEFLDGEPARMTIAERDVLAARGLSGVRLSCQIVLRSRYDGSHHQSFGGQRAKGHRSRACARYHTSSSMDRQVTSESATALAHVKGCIMEYPRIGEALVRGERHRLSAAEPELIIGDLNGPVGVAFATLLGGQVEGHTRVLALLNGDVAVKPATLMVSKVTVKKSKYTNILMGSVQAGVAHGVLDAVRDGLIPRDEVNKIGIIASVWLYPEVVESNDLDFNDLFATHRKSMHQAIRKAMKGEPTIDWLLENQDSIVHSYHQKGLEGKL